MVVASSSAGSGLVTTNGSLTLLTERTALGLGAGDAWGAGVELADELPEGCPDEVDVLWADVLWAEVAAGGLDGAALGVVDGSGVSAGLDVPVPPPLMPLPKPPRPSQ